MNIKEIGLKVKERRKVLKIDQISLAEIAGISVHTLSNIESGITNPRIETIYKILDSLGYIINIELKLVGKDE
jgi:transcriptional regulator with XRE-family HTH domain